MSFDSEGLLMDEPKIQIQNLNVWYGSHHALKDVTTDIYSRGITVIIGPSGCGKSTLLKSLNRLLEETERVRITGRVTLDGCDIYDQAVDVTEVRTRIGLLAPKPFPLPMSIFDNVAYGPRIHRHIHRHTIDGVVERYLHEAGLWDEVRDRIRSPASRLSTGQQQRLCLARALAAEPEIHLCDEPTSALDPISAQRIEQQLTHLKRRMTVVIVTHMLRQARRLADYVLFLWMGELVESGPAAQIFKEPRDERTKAYLAGDIG
ncbi:MAG: phosphate ABC transporter ATP-binding protein [Chloroflexi bacterium RBG_16_48_8]|nr:MAG: phosphate ABC transporter ATP-binding protein [Chloroflexi bacterium RBG_16_48_8]